MTTNNRIRTTELDFDQIKDNLKDYFRGQDQFSDYDFEGSGLSILLDVLAYNTHYRALYDNLSTNEAFLDSASKRSSVVSKAKEIGYVPTSIRAAQTSLNITFINNSVNAPEFYEIPRYTQFTTSLNGRSYTFYSLDPRVSYKNGNQYVFENVLVKEGTLLNFRFVYDNPSSRFIIPNPDVDTTTLRVSVQKSGTSSVFENFEFSDTVLNIDDSSPVYFLKQNDDALYEIEFGNGSVGKRLSPGNVINISYFVTRGEDANGARTFTYSGSAPSGVTPYVTANSPSFGGAAEESIQDIKWNAPRAYTAQNRCVSLDDYKTIINSLYPNARSTNVWGGEENNPPAYGRVFISVVPDTGEALSDSEKDLVLNEIIGPRRMATVFPGFVDPSFIRAQIDTTFYYDPKMTNRSAGEISAIVRDTIRDYNQENLNKFDSVLKYSALSRAIDSCEESIISNITNLKLHCTLDPIYNRSIQYRVDLGNPIYNSNAPTESIISTGINVLNIQQVAYIDDVPTPGTDQGVLRLFYYIQSQKVPVRNIGTVDYRKGVITFDNLIITGLAESEFKFIIKPQSNDVASVRNQIVSIDSSLITVRPQIETTANQYKFTSSRN